MARRARPLDVVGWSPGTKLDPVDFLLGHLNNKWIGEPEALRLATEAAVCRELMSRGLTGDQAVRLYQSHYRDRLTGIFPCGPDVVFDFAAGEVDQPHIEIFARAPVLQRKPA